MFLIGGKTMGRGSRRRGRAVAEEKRGEHGKLRAGGIRGFVVPALVVCLTLGVVTGAVYANVIEGAEYNRLSANVEYFFNHSGEIMRNREAVFFETLIKYGKTPLLIWFLAFIPPGALVSFIFIFVKGAGVGFTTALLARHFGGAGMYYAVVLYLLQNMAIIPAYLYVSIESMNFAADLLRIPGSATKKTAVSGLLNAFGGAFTAGRLIEYLFALIVSFVCVVFAALTEAYCVPFLIDLFVLYS